jgi:hypothetical protein
LKLEHLVSVWIPPFTSSISLPVNSRAPFRANTLSWSFIVIFLSVRCRTKPCKRAAFQRDPPARRLSNGATFSNIAIGVAAYAAGAHSQRPESAAYLLDFLFVQLPCFLAD